MLWLTEFNSVLLCKECLDKCTVGILLLTRQFEEASSVAPTKKGQPSTFEADIEQWHSFICSPRSP